MASVENHLNIFNYDTVLGGDLNHSNYSLPWIQRKKTKVGKSGGSNLTAST